MPTSEPPTMVAGEAGAGATRLIIRRPDDWHVHLRDGPMLAAVVNYTARQFARAIVMPNLDPPVTTVTAARDYRERIIAALEPGVDFEPLMTCYLTDSIAPAEVAQGFTQGVFTACKLYPAHATTNSALGVTDFRRIYPVFETMQRIGMPLLLHGEVIESHIDVFDREAVFIDRILTKIIADFPALRIVFEHITTAEAVAFVDAAGPNLAATITPHHLAINRNAMFEGGIRPHFYCLPVAKREVHRLALRRAATSGSAKFFLGTDSAPHALGERVRRRLRWNLQCAVCHRELCQDVRGRRRAEPARGFCIGKRCTLLWSAVEFLQDHTGTDLKPRSRNPSCSFNACRSVSCRANAGLAFCWPSRSGSGRCRPIVSGKRASPRNTTNSGRLLGRFTVRSGSKS